MCVDALASVLLTSRYPPSSHRASRELGSLHPVSFLGTSSFVSSIFTHDLNPFPLIRLRAHHRQHTPLASSPTSSSRVYTTHKTPTHKTLLRPSVSLSGNHCGPVVCIPLPQCRLGLHPWALHLPKMLLPQGHKSRYIHLKYQRCRVLWRVGWSWGWERIDSSSTMSTTRVQSLFDKSPTVIRGTARVPSPLSMNYMRQPRFVSAEALFGRTFTKSFTSPALLVRVVS